MKLSYYIRHLQELQRIHGDIPVKAIGGRKEVIQPRLPQPASIKKRKKYEKKDVFAGPGDEIEKIVIRIY